MVAEQPKTKATIADRKRAQGLGSAQDLAIRLGVSGASVKTALAVGRIDRRPDGWYDLARAERQFRATALTDMGEPTSTEESDSDDTAGAETVAAVRKRKMVADADLAEARAAEVKGALVELAAVQSTWFSATRALRSRLEAIPAVVSPSLEGLDTAQRLAKLTEAIRAALLDFPADAPATQ